MVKLKHGQVISISLNPYIDQSTFGIFVNLYKLFNIDKDGLIPFDNCFLIYDCFIKSNETLEINELHKFDFLMNPITHLWDRDLFDFMTIVGKVKVSLEDFPFRHFKIPTKEIYWNTEDHHLEGYFSNFHSTDDEIYEIQPKSGKIEIGKYSRLSTNHISYGQNYFISTYYIRDKVYLEYLRKYEPQNFNFKYWSNLKLQQDDELMYQIFLSIFNRNFNLKPLWQIKKEFHGKVIPQDAT